MLEVMVMTVEIGVDIVFLKQRQNALNQFGLVAMLAARINRMVGKNDFPLCL